MCTLQTCRNLELRGRVQFSRRQFLKVKRITLGEEIIARAGGEPVAKLSPPARHLSAYDKGVRVTDGFFDPLPPAIPNAFE